ncbi:hypothetical protein D3C75_142080 [compost metagenome]
MPHSLLSSPFFAVSRQQLFVLVLQHLTLLGFRVLPAAGPDQALLIFKDAP